MNPKKFRRAKARRRRTYEQILQRHAREGRAEQVEKIRSLEATIRTMPREDRDRLVEVINRRLLVRFVQGRGSLGIERTLEVGWHQHQAYLPLPQEPEPVSWPDVADREFVQRVIDAKEYTLSLHRVFGGPVYDYTRADFLLDEINALGKLLAEAIVAKLLKQGLDLKVLTHRLG